MKSQYRLMMYASLLLLGACGKPKKEVDGQPKAKPVVVSKLFGLGKIEPQNGIVALACDVSGKVVKIGTSENAVVKKGDVLVTLDQSVEAARVAKWKQTTQSQRAQLSADSANLADIEFQLENSRANLQRLESLLTTGAESKQAVDDARTKTSSLVANSNRLKAVVGVSQSKLAEAKAELIIATQELEQKTLRAPDDGIVLELVAQVGAVYRPGDVLVQFSPAGNKVAVCEIDELFALKVSQGQTAEIRWIGSTQPIAKGKVIFVGSFLKKKSLFSDETSDAEDRRVRTVKIDITEQLEEILSNSRVECVISVNQ